MKKIIEDLIRLKQKKRVLVIGDLMIDEYLFGCIDRISPEAPVPVVRRVRDEYCLGGAANVAANCKHIGLKTVLIGIVNSNDASGKVFFNALHTAGISTEGVVHSDGRATTSKRRVMTNNNQQCLRIDYEDSHDLSEKEYKALLAQFDSLIKPDDVIMLSDYAKGVLNHNVIRHIIKKARQLGNIILVDPKGPNFDKYRGVDYLKPNMSEFNEMCTYFGYTKTDLSVQDKARSLCEKLSLKGIIITMGEKGIRFISDRHDLLVPAYKQEVYDLSGAGDTVFAFLGLSYAHGLSIKNTLKIANKAASVAVSHIKTYAVSLEELFSTEQSLFNGIINDWARLKIELDWLRAEGKRIVFTNGCFDIIHSGHIYLLQEAKRRGDILVVALNSDDSVRTLGKGNGRPVNTLHERAKVMAGIKGVDFITSFSEETPASIIEYLAPDVLVKGGDYKKEEVVGYNFITKSGGEVCIIDLVPGRSTTNVIKKLDKTSRDTQVSL